MERDILAVLAKGENHFSKGQKLIAKYILENYDKAAFMTAGKLGQTVGVSESTVVRFASELGYDGYPEMRKAIQEMIWIALIGLAICILFGLILVMKSGRNKKDDEVYMAPLDNMWVEIRVAIDGAIAFFSGWLFLDELFSLSNSFVVINAVLMTALAVVVAAALLDLILYITRHIKNRDLGKSFMVAWIFNKIIKGIWSFFRKNKEKLKAKKEEILRRYDDSGNRGTI